MKKINQVTLFATLAFAQSAMAQDYLFATDVLDVGKLDMQAGVFKSSSEKMVSTLPSTGKDIAGKAESNYVAESVGIRYGFAEGWHVGASLVYDSVDNLTFDGKPVLGHKLNYSARKINYEKSVSTNIWIKHQLIGDNASPFTLAATVGVTPNAATGNTNGGNTTYMNAGLDAGWRLSESLKAFAGYGLSMPEHDNLNTHHSIYFGLDKKITPDWTLVPALSVHRYEGSDFVSPITSYALNLQARISLAETTYLIPNYSYYLVDEFHDVNGHQYSEVNGGNEFGISLYHLF